MCYFQITEKNNHWIIFCQKIATFEVLLKINFSNLIYIYVNLKTKISTPEENRIYNAKMLWTF